MDVIVVRAENDGRSINFTYLMYLYFLKINRMTRQGFSQHIK